MAVDYDVVIIGGSLAGRYAAVAATQLKATVALIEPIPRSEGSEGEDNSKFTRHSKRATQNEPLATRPYPLTTHHLPVACCLGSKI